VTSSSPKTFNNGEETAISVAPRLQGVMVHCRKSAVMDCHTSFAMTAVDGAGSRLPPLAGAARMHGDADSRFVCMAGLRRKMRE
jgi:hypothetical protein